MVYENMEALIGATPIMRLSRFGGSNLFGKLEMFNPSGSAKDRAALYMINDAEEKGLLAPGGVIIEPTSGNTGIGLAAIGVKRGYRVILVMPDTMSRERIRLMTSYGAEAVLTPGAQGMKGAIEKAEQLKNELGGMIAGQFENPANPKAHFETTGPEIWKDMEGSIGAFVAGVGTGGTLTGIGRYLKQMDPAISIIAVEPAASPLISEGHAGPHGLQGIGANFIPDNYDASVVDRVVTVSNEDAFAATKRLSRTEGLLVGITSGAAALAAARIAAEMPGKNVVALLPDNGDRYLSGGIYD